MLQGHGDGFLIRANEAAAISWKRVGTDTNSCVLVASSGVSKAVSRFCEAMLQ